MNDTSGRKTRSSLGRGLGALMADRSENGTSIERDTSGIRLLPIASIQPHQEQPRRRFEEGALDELAQSIAVRGVIQPIIVRPVGDGYQIVAGERRWRAAQRAQLHEIPVIVRELSDADTLEIALLENIQRQDLNAIEEAEAYSRLIEQFGHTQEALAKIVNKSRSHISNLIRLLDLPDEVRTLVVDGRLEMGHARALLGAPDPVALAERVVEEGMSVRAIEKVAKEAKAPRKVREVGAREATSGAPDADIAALERQLGDLLGLSVRISHGAQGGTLTLNYASLDQLDMVCQRLSGEVI